MKTNRKLFCHQKPSADAVSLWRTGGLAMRTTTRRAQNQFWLPILTVLMMLSSHREVQAAHVLRSIDTFTGMVDSVDFEVPAELLGGMPGEPPVPVSTGIVTMSLAPFAPNAFGLDNVTESGCIDVTLVLNIPLLVMLGEPAPSIRIIEAGPAMITAGAGSHDFVFDASLVGGGIINTGLLSGVTFSNVNTYLGEGINSSWEVVSPPDITWSLGNSAVVMFPAGLGGSTVMGIDGSGDLTVLSEPATPPGDGNGDHDVDAADYTTWANNFGQIGAGNPGDYNNNGIVDAADYTIWANNFGQSVCGEGPLAVPEPSTLTLATFGMIGLLACGWRRRRRA